MFRIGPPTDTPLAFRVCKDATLGAVAWQSGELHVYRVRIDLYFIMILDIRRIRKLYDR
jgi:hypothetical protein